MFDDLIKEKKKNKNHLNPDTKCFQDLWKIMGTGEKERKNVRRSNKTKTKSCGDKC